VIQFKALVRLEDWPAAESTLAEIEREGDKKQFYLRGFYCWKRRDFGGAAKAFQSALEAHDRANAVYRDYAEVLYRLGQYDRALSMIETVQRRDPGNVFVLDLVARISIDGKLWAQAKVALTELERADVDGRFIHHRRSRFYSGQGLLDLALVEANAAAVTGASPFEAVAQKADVLTELHDFASAEATLEELKQRFGKTQSDVQNGLRCKLLLRQGKWREANAVWNTLIEKHSPVHLALLRQILVLKAEDPNLGEAEREAGRRQADALQADPLVPRVLDDSGDDPPMTSE
jgi:tetratricopeptide (TPR) repeat protein